MDPAFGYWLAGFIDGEGCFLIRRDTSQDNFACLFEMKLRADDRPILDEICERAGCGKVVQKRARLGAKPQVMWRMGSRADALRLVAILDEFPLRAKKRRDYVIWREAVIAWQEVPGRGHRGFDWSHIASLQAALQAVRSYPKEEVSA